jgi:peroxiredoxin
MFRTAAAALAFAAGLALVGLSHAADAKADKKVGQFNKKVKPGDPAPTFKDLQGVDNKKHSLDEFKDKDVVVVVITCNHCPVAQAYQDRIIDFTKKYAAKGVAVVAINCNDPSQSDGADSFEKMVERSKEKGYNFPYLFDPSQQIGRDLGATVTPEFFVLNKERKIVYLGAMDNDQNKPTTNYLEPAIEATLKGKTPEIQETAGHGCSVKYKAASK